MDSSSSFLTVQVPVAHLVGHVADEQSLAWLCGSPLVQVPPVVAGVTTLVELHGHPPALEDLLVQSFTSGIGLLLAGELDVCKTLAQTPIVGNDPAVGDLTELGELGLELRSGDLEEEVANVEDLAGGCGSAVLVGPALLEGIPGVVSSASCLSGGGLRLFADLRGGFRRLLADLRGSL